MSVAFIKWLLCSLTSLVLIFYGLGIAADSTTGCNPSLPVRFVSFAPDSTDSTSYVSCIRSYNEDNIIYLLVEDDKVNEADLALSARLMGIMSNGTMILNKSLTIYGDPLGIEVLPNNNLLIVTSNEIQAVDIMGHYSWNIRTKEPINAYLIDDTFNVTLQYKSQSADFVRTEYSYESVSPDGISLWNYYDEETAAISQVMGMVNNGCLLAIDGFVFIYITTDGQRQRIKYISSAFDDGFKVPLPLGITGIPDLIGDYDSAYQRFELEPCQLRGGNATAVSMDGRVILINISDLYATTIYQCEEPFPTDFEVGSNNELYIALPFSGVCCINNIGVLKWKCRAHGNRYLKLLCGYNDAIVAIGNLGVCLIIDAQGNLRWTYQLPREQYFNRPIIDQDYNLYIYSDKSIYQIVCKSAYD